MKIKIRTTKSDIDRWQEYKKKAKGTPYICDCPIKAAIKRDIKTRYVYVGIAGVSMELEGSKKAINHGFNRKVQQWITQLDACVPVKPISITLNFK